jgi:pre-mRNA-splicing factor 18
MYMLLLYTMMCSSVSGRKATLTHKQCKDYIRPLFKLLKKNKVPVDIFVQIKAIVEFCEQREYVKANDCYLQIAIGNSAWPIGVTSVGIHMRTGRERIQSDRNVHVMNNEVQKKYITNIRRLITYAQTKFPTDPSKMCFT